MKKSMKIQYKNSISWILPKIQVKIQYFEEKNDFLNLLLNLFDTGSFIWGITFHNLKYLDKPIKCLEMRAKIKSVRKINEIFLCIFTYIWKPAILSPYLNFDKIFFLVILKAKYQNVQTKIFWIYIQACWWNIDVSPIQNHENTLYIDHSVLVLIWILTAVLVPYDEW